MKILDILTVWEIYGDLPGPIDGLCLSLAESCSFTAVLQVGFEYIGPTHYPYGAKKLGWA